ncbi:alpha-E domain-containing protein [Pseudoxanthomonas sp. SGNA-20]|uniref:Putative alpha-E superfamily protein n=1 Tax=Pseudoxanthomonas taiwanensis J19 TaxID=935569 RepID=A0A562DJ24_9GAMM|nr:MULTISPECIES: alpha-E domain-containing protein [Pseudoxanthomonas]RRN59205.1 alpha-E domain-containing protein [Pseudoxanthomonas sp. SGNA-20]RRN78882.1 alpha-E domain-containing protein [Pseudoxanthomonas sp. SGD-10]TWH09669.1 putative alpha-E superfamily protein [Pseudoxanthomonas taiwanensis J19]
MLSRVASQLYWFSRYLRRAENTARLVGVGSLLQLDLPRSVRFTWRPMIATVGAEELFLGVHPEPDEADVLDFLLLDARNPSSLRSSVAQAREILRSIRDALPQEVWEAVNDLHLYLDADGPRVLTRRYRMDFIGRITDGCLKVSGLLQANVSRDMGFHFLRLGTAIEQADMTTRIIDAGASGLVRPRHEDDLEAWRNMQWMAVLRALAAYQMYRRHLRQRVTAAHALRFLLHDNEFPRSVQFCLGRLHRILPALPPRPPVDRALNRVTGLVRQADPALLAAGDPAGFMDEAQVLLGRLHEAIAEGYFAG